MDVNKMIAQILKQLCCIWEIINSGTSIIFGTSFTGAGTEADPKQVNVFAEGAGYGGGTGTETDPLIINGGGGGVVYDNPSNTNITFSGSGITGDPLIADVSAASTLNQLVSGKPLPDNTFNATLTQSGTYSYRVWEGNISFYNAAGAVLGGTISGNTAGQLGIAGGTNGIFMPSTVTIQGTGSTAIVNAPSGSAVSTSYSLNNVATARVGVSGTALELVALNAAGNVNITPGASGSVVFPLTGLAAGTNTPIAAGDTILIALAKLQAQIDAIAP